MKKLFPLGLLLFPLIMQAQTIDYNKIILPDRIQNVEFKERLVQLAWKNHPTNKIALQNVEMARKLKKEAKLTWLDDVSATGNLNEFTIDPDPVSQNRAQFYPRYNFGIRLSFGTFALTPLRARIANDQMITSEHEVNERKLEVRNLVMTAVEKLEEHYKIMRIRSWLKEDFLIMYKDAEKKFSQGQIPIAQYQAAVQAYYSRSEEVITAQSNFNQQRIEIEALIGLPLEDIEGYSEFIAELDRTTTRD